jgi:hypothetical protein
MDEQESPLRHPSLFDTDIKNAMNFLFRQSALPGRLSYFEYVTSQLRVVTKFSRTVSLFAGIAHHRVAITF